MLLRFSSDFLIFLQSVAIVKLVSFMLLVCTVIFYVMCCLSVVLSAVQCLFVISLLVCSESFVNFYICL